VFDIKTNAITLTGNVVVTQGTSVLVGESMVVDLTTGVTRVDSVSGLFSQGAPAPAAATAPAPAAQKSAKPPPAAKAAPGAPIRINQNMQPKKPAT
jgi:lipopolysaccharide export system protein LptA